MLIRSCLKEYPIDPVPYPDDPHLRRLDAIALNFMNRYALRIDGQLARIAETEIYYDAPEYPDCFCHRHPEQAKYESWYYHYSGYDVTFGKDGAYVGALVRGIQWAEDGEWGQAGAYLYGPGRVGYRWKPKKAPREIELVKGMNHDFRIHTLGSYVYDTQVLTLPRVNLSKERMLKAIASGDRKKISQMQEALNRKARYLRLPERFWELKEKPDDVKSIVSHAGIGITTRG